MAFNIRNYLGITGTQPAIKHDNHTNPVPDELLNRIDVDLNHLIQIIAGCAGPALGGVPLTTAPEIKDRLDKHIAANGLDKFYPPGDPRIEAIAKNAEQVIKEGTAPLCKPEHAEAISYFCLYDVVLYLDDSYSMTLDAVRIPTQAAFARRLCEILFPYQADTKAAVRFINDARTWDSLTTGAAVEQAVKSAAYNGYTPIGTQLKNKILQPMLYDKLAAGTLTKPVFVIVITDGWPYNEAADLFRNNIVEANAKIKAAGMRRSGGCLSSWGVVQRLIVRSFDVQHQPDR